MFIICNSLLLIIGCYLITKGLLSIIRKEASGPPRMGFHTRIVDFTGTAAVIYGGFELMAGVLFIYGAIVGFLQNDWIPVAYSLIVVAILQLIATIVSTIVQVLQNRRKHT